MAVEKKKPGRPKKAKEPTLEELRKEKIHGKLPTFIDKNEEELLKTLFADELSSDSEESPYYEEVRELEHKKRDGLWDVTSDEEVKYFDPELSYELTGYRPINMTQGLEFDPRPYMETREVFERTKKYTEYPKGSKYYNDFWNEQYKRCVQGYTIGNYRITGDHYFFLNFYRMQTINEDSNKKTTGRHQGFPIFASKQYEFFHYVELCEYIAKDVCMLKARGLGFSEILACIGVRPFITTREFRTVYTAAAEPQLDPVLDKCWTQLNWLNLNTNGGMKRLRQKVDNIRQKRASLLDKDGTEYGRFAEIEGIVADNPRKIRGDRVERLIFEEGGSNKNSVTSWIQGNALVEIGGNKIGTRIIGGTGGDSGDPLVGLSKIFSNPIGYNILPYKNFYTRDGKVQYTGFFIPAHEFALDSAYLDNRGVTDNVRFKEYYETRRKLLEGTDLLDYCAEHCFTPDEALLKQGDNIFDAEILSQRLTDIRVHGMGIKPERTALIWDHSETDALKKVKAIPNANSKILVVEPPLVDEDGNTFKNLYVAGIDSIDMGTSDSASDTDVSDFCIVIKRRAHGMKEPKYVAIYKDRPRDIREAFNTAMKLLTWYNCQAVLEYTKITIQTYFKENGKGHLFMSRPEFAITTKTKKSRKNKTLVGVPGTEHVIKHGLELINMYVSDYADDIDFDEMLEQLLNYSYKLKRKFDVVAAMQMAEIGDEEMSGIPPTALIDKSKETWQDFGYYTDEDGKKRYGAIPDKRPYYETRWRL